MTIFYFFRSTVTKTNGEKYGIYPTLIQSKFRVDEKRPMGKDGKEKAPWSKFKNELKTELDYVNESVTSNFKNGKNKEYELDYVNESVTSNFKKIDNLVLEVKEVLSGNEILLRECKGRNQVPLNSNFQKITSLMLQVKELLLKNDIVFWEYAKFESGFI